MRKSAGNPAPAGTPDTGGQTETRSRPQEPDQTGTSPAVAGPGGREDPPRLPSKLTFRVTRVSLVVVLVIAVCVTPVAWTSPPLLALYVIPLALVVWVLRTRTVVDRERITAHTLFRTRRIAWEDVRSFRLDQHRWVRVILRTTQAGEQDKGLVLPTVRVRDLSRLAELSGGRLPDISAEPTEAQPATEEPDATEADTADTATVSADGSYATPDTEASADDTEASTAGESGA